MSFLFAFYAPALLLAWWRQWQTLNPIIAWFSITLCKNWINNCAIINRLDDAGKTRLYWQLDQQKKRQKKERGVGRTNYLFFVAINNCEKSTLAATAEPENSFHWSQDTCLLETSSDIHSGLFIYLQCRFILRPENHPGAFISRPENYWDKKSLVNLKQVKKHSTPVWQKKNHKTTTVDKSKWTGRETAAAAVFLGDAGCIN